jgi:geranylgeranyl reductase family protein
MTEHVWDVAVVGAGPAGSAAALSALRRDPSASVLLLDAAEFPRDKVCGDGVAPQALDVLAALGVDPATLCAGTEPTQTFRLHSPGGVRVVRPFARAARVVPRRLFDHRLLSCAIEAGAQFERRRVHTVEVFDDHVVLDGSVRARAVVGADGAESVVRRASGHRPAPPSTTAIALRGYAPAAPFARGEQVLVMTRQDWPAYAWAFPVGDGTVNVGYGQLLRGPAPSRAHLELRLHELLPDAHATSLRGHRLPLSTGRPVVGSGRVLLAGDAASLINPLTGEGIFYAVKSGELAGAAALEPDPGRCYRDALHRALGRHLRQTDVIARLAGRTRFVDAVAAATAVDQSFFDAVVDLGLADGRITARNVPALVRYGVPALAARSVGRKRFA